MIVHRLDYATSGVVVFACNDYALAQLHSQFRKDAKCDHTFKSYVAVVDGKLENERGTINLPLGKDSERGPPYHKVDTSSNAAKKSITNWNVIKRGKSASLVRLTPITGRTHQLRLHMAAIGHPILGDHFYPPRAQTMQMINHFRNTTSTHSRPDDLNYVNPIPSAFERSDRLLLHAEELQLQHPRTKQTIKFTAECPFNLEMHDV